ncbi:MAG TPA: DUF6282 family protein [Bryobacteraceae bacterium]|nr:DUF6282 family protein [Bryobacteraceae bacterium]
MTPYFLVFAFTAAAWGQSLQGVMDIHAHSDPDSVPRSIDALNLVRLAKQKGYRGLVLKNHYEPTAAWAALARQEVPGIEVFGGIALNRTVGGVNPVAVERMTRVKGGYGRVVWMPTFDSENHMRVTKEQRPFVSVSRGAKLLPEVLEVLDLIAKNKLVLATGHSSPAEVLMLVREARRRGVKSIVVTHAMLKYVAMSTSQMKAAVEAGAMIEFVGNAVIGTQKEFEFPQYAGAMREVGWNAVILSSDFGQAGNPLHPDGLEQIFKGLRQQGVSEAQINQVVKTNPSKLLALQ